MKHDTGDNWGRRVTGYTGGKNEVRREMGASGSMTGDKYYFALSRRARGVGGNGREGGDP